MQPQRSGPVARCPWPSTAGRFPACVSQRGYSAWRKSCTVLPEHLHPQLGVARLTVRRREATSRAGQVTSSKFPLGKSRFLGLGFGTVVCPIRQSLLDFLGHIPREEAMLNCWCSAAVTETL